RGLSAAALRVRSARPCQSRQGDAHTAAVRRGSRPIPRAPAGARGRRDQVLMPRQLTPADPEAAAAALAGAAAGGEAVRLAGAGTKSAWGALPRAPDVELHTAKLNRILEHNEGDLTAVLEAGVPLARAQEQFASAGQMLALDPFLGAGEEASLGGVLATADSGPIRHRYGSPRDLVLGMTVALS